MSTWILQESAPGPGLRVAVKDLIDIAGLPDHGGARAVADGRGPGGGGRGLPRGARSPGGRPGHVVGKTNLHELAFGVTGINPWFGTPVNPLDPALVPGGSSSGSAVAVATGEADVALGHRHRRVDPHPGRVLRGGRAEDHLGPDPARRGLAARAVAGHRRADGT